MIYTLTLSTVNYVEYGACVCFSALHHHSVFHRQRQKKKRIIQRVLTTWLQNHSNLN